jgi:hypothetical protein
MRDSLWVVAWVICLLMGCITLVLIVMFGLATIKAFWETRVQRKHRRRR